MRTLIIKKYKKTPLFIVLSLLLAIFSMPESAQAAACTPTSSSSGGTTKLTFSTVGACQWTVPSGIKYMRFLIVAGGGGGGGGAYGGGGGGGAVITSTSVAVTSGASINLQVGGGGTGGTNSITATNDNNENAAGSDGGDSYIGNYRAKGGGGGGGFFTGPFNDRYEAEGRAGGNQGGGSQDSTKTNFYTRAIWNQTSAIYMSPENRISIYAFHDGGATYGSMFAKAGGGGGGAERPGKNVVADAQGGDGGDGAAINFEGTSATYGGGGGGGVTNFGSAYLAGQGGAGGGGDGGVTGDGEAGQTNTGGGGGGAGYGGTPRFGGAGGSGLIVITYKTNVCLEGGSCSIGDEGPAAGTIFYIDTATNTAYESTPKYWQATCAGGGLCNLGDIGWGGGPIIGTAGGNYLEISPDTMEEKGQFLQFNAGIFGGAWRDAYIADYLKAFENKYQAGLHGSTSTIWNDDYWTLDADPQTGRQYVVNPQTGEVSLARGNYFPPDEYWNRIFGTYSSGDNWGEYDDDDSSYSALATSTEIGFGESNTALMVNSSTTGIAQIATGFTVNGKSDWFLPSLREMMALASMGSAIENLNLGNSNYWTSSNDRANLYTAYYVMVSTPNTIRVDNKFEAKAIRPVRSFSIAAASAPSLTLAMNSGLRTAVFRVSNTITATSTESGRVTFYADGKKIAGCIGLATSSNTVSCSWKPAIRKAQRLTAVLKTTGGQYSTIQDLMVSVVSRTTRR
jgi:hypothetical protein